MADEIPPGDSINSQSPASGSSSIRKTVFFFIGFVVSLIIGKGFEVVTSEETYKKLETVQSTWRTSLEQYSPISLATGYWDDLQIVFGGGPLNWVPAGKECKGYAYASQINCALSPFYVGKAQVAKCHKIVTEAKAKLHTLCTAWTKQSANSTQNSERHGLKNAILSPIFAVLRTWSRLTYNGGWSYLWAFLQLFLGFIVFMLVYPLFSDSRYETRHFPESVLGWLLIVPPGVIVVASLIALALKYVMLGGLTAFGWFTGLAEVCCAATGIGGFCWFCFHKFTEYSVSEAVGGKLK